MRITLVIIALVVLTGACTSEQAADAPYAGEQVREIAAFSSEDLKALRAGAGTPFGGMALPGELNGYPGPKHVLELEDALNLTDDQRDRTRAIFDSMHADARAIGNELIAVERELDESFKNTTITERMLSNLTARSAQLYGELRARHLSAHLEMLDVLDDSQRDAYSRLRGYGDGCDVPEGHDPGLWAQHHGC